MQLIQELRAGTAHFDSEKTQWYTKAPTRLNLQAARKLEEFIQVIQGLENANLTLVRQLDEALKESDAQRRLLEKLLADAQLRSQDVMGPDAENSEPGASAAGNQAQQPSSPA